jgi:bacillopeptidase F (M6 metalloprotease family)
VSLGDQVGRNGWSKRLLRGGMRGGLAVLLTVLLPVSSIAAAAGPKAPTVPKPGGDKAKMVAASRYPTAKQMNPASKIHKEVSQAFTSTKQVSYLVTLHAKANVNEAAKTARGEASPAQREVAARSAVIKELQVTAESTQMGLLKQLEAFQKKGQVTKFQPFWVSNMVLVTSTMDVMEQIAKRSEVAQILPNKRIKMIEAAPAKSQGEPLIQGDLGAQSVEWGIQRVGAPMVWNTYGVTGAGTVVAGMDTGVDWDHPALMNRWRGYNPSTGATDPTYSWFDAVGGQAMPYDDHGHGTHTIGTAVGQDGANEIGVAPGAQWIGIKILDGGGFGTTEDILEAAEWLLAPGGDPSKAPDVVNNSWGGGPGVDDWMRDLVSAWRAAGIFPTFSAGNDGSADGSVGNPGNYPEAFAVGATDSNDNLASFSGRGPSPYGGIIKPEIAAPGVNVRSSVPGGGYEGGWSGTSMSAPHVAGTVALLRSVDASLTVEELEQILFNSADPKTDSRYSNVPNNGFGHGILNAFNAVGMVMNGVGSISGRVLTGGDDFDPPMVTHTAVTEAFKALPIDVTASVSDNVSVTGVYLRFRMPGMSWWGEVEMTRTSGDFTAGEYAGAIPADVTGGSSVEYYVLARDFGGNDATHGSSRRPHAVTLLDGLQPGYLLDFEGAATGWIHGGTNDSWEIGEPTSGPGNAHSGTKVAATNLEGPYPNGSESYLMSPPIDLSGVASAALRYWHWYQLENGWDVGYLLASGDGGMNWDILQEITGNGMEWREAVVDMSAYAGNSTVLIAFYLSTDGSVQQAGWYLDDINLYVDTEAPAAPANLTAAAMPSGTVGLSWEPVSAGDLAHYTVYRSGQPGTGYAVLNTAENANFVDSGVLAGTTYYYVVTASDRYGHESGYSNEASVTAPAATVVFNDDMESGAPGWTHSGAADSWQLGAPTSGPGAAHSGSNLWATNLAGNYPVSHNASLVSPPIALTGLASASLQFAHWYALERNWDFGIVEASSNGGATWTELARYTNPSGSASVGWEMPVIDLSAYANQTVQIRFRMTSDSSITMAGWYIDDVRVAGLGASGQGINRPLSVQFEKPGTKGKPKAASKPQMTMPAKKAASFRKLSSADLETSRIGMNSLPLDATVTVVEAGRVVRTDPSRGTFNLTMPAGTFTLRAEAYGYFPQERTVTVEADAEANVLFVLQPMPRGTLTGRVTNMRTGEPASGVRMSLVEDPRVPSVTTDANGMFHMQPLEGAYTLEARSRGFYPASTAVTVTGGQTTTADMALEPFVGVPGEIAYDDGSADNAWAFFAAGNAFAVRMSPAQPGQATVIRGARVYHWDASWPGAGATSFQVAVYEVKPDGTPGRLLGGPVRRTDAVLGGWTDVDLSALGLTVTGDFIVAWVQDADHPGTPGLAVDESSGDSGRNLQMVSGAWSEWADGGNFMIRAIVDYEVGAPTILSPANGSFTNQADVNVAGTAHAGTTVNLTVNGAASSSALVGNDGNWSTMVSLDEGSHVLSATSSVAGGATTRPSEPVRVTVDLTAPDLTVAAPADGHSQNDRVITVTGSVSDAHMGSVNVNGTAASVQADGSFVVELVGQAGANTVTVTATDLAGNVSTATRTVQIDTGGPALNNLQPAADRTMMTGEQLIISFDSEPGLALAAFSISLNSLTSEGTKNGVASLQPGERAMQETSPGHYEATWTLPAGVSAPQAFVNVRAVDAAGNESRATADGVLTLVANNAPTAVISAPTSGRRNTNITFDGRGSSDSDGSIVSYVWAWGDGTANSTGARPSHSFRTAGTYTVTLTVTDNRGATGTATWTITIR